MEAAQGTSTSVPVLAIARLFGGLFPQEFFMEIRITDTPGLVFVVVILIGLVHGRTVGCEGAMPGKKIN